MKMRTLLMMATVLATNACTKNATPSFPAQETTDGTDTSQADTEGDLSTTTTGASSDTEDAGSSGEQTTADNGSSTGGGDSGEPAGTCLGFDVDGHAEESHLLDGGTGEPSCDPVPQACGGDPVGVWTIDASCGYGEPPGGFFGDCAGAVETSELNVTGTRTFSEDSTVTTEIVFEGTVNVQLDAQSCFDVDCDGFQALLLGDFMAHQATCEASNEGTCDCTVVYRDEFSDSGTWEVSGDVVTVSLPGYTAAYPFCREGDRLDLWVPLYATTNTEQACDTDEDCAEALGQEHEDYLCDTSSGPGPG
jgi:hypothetical protein